MCRVATTVLGTLLLASHAFSPARQLRPSTRLRAAAVADEKNAFILFNSGAYQLKTPAAKAAKAVAQEGTADIFAAVDAKDAGKLKAAYAAYTKNAGIDLSPAKESVMGGQGFGSDYDWKNRTPKGTVYQR